MCRHCYSFYQFSHSVLHCNDDDDDDDDVRSIFVLQSLLSLERFIIIAHPVNVDSFTPATAGDNNRFSFSFCFRLILQFSYLPLPECN